MKYINVVYILFIFVTVACGGDDKKDASYYFKQGEQFFKDNNYPSAINSLKKLLEIYPEYHQANYKIGELYFRLQKYSEAIPYLEQSIELDNTSFMSYHLLADCLASAGRLNEAEQAELRALKIASVHTSTAQTGLSCIYEIQGDHDQAIDQAEKAMEQNPKQLEYRRLGTLHFKAGHYKEAIDALEHTRGLEENFPDIYFTRGMSYLGLNQTDKAQHEYEQLKKHDQILSQELLRKISQTN